MLRCKSGWHEIENIVSVLKSYFVSSTWANSWFHRKSCHSLSNINEPHLGDIISREMKVLLSWNRYLPTVSRQTNAVFQFVNYQSNKKHRVVAADDAVKNNVNNQKTLAIARVLFLDIYNYWAWSSFTLSLRSSERLVRKVNNSVVSSIVAIFSSSLVIRLV